MRKILTVGAVLFGIGVAAFFGLRATTGSKTATQPSKPRSVPEEVQLAESGLLEITRLLGEKRHEEAAAVCNRVFDRLTLCVERASDLKNPKGIDLAQEAGRLRAQMNETLQQAMRDEVAALRAGAPDNRNVLRLQRSFGHTKDLDLWRIYESAIPELDVIRSKLATRWIRIYNRANVQTDYDDLISGALAARVAAPPGYTIAFGPPVGWMEARALFCVVDMDLRPAWSTYSVGLKNRPGVQLAETEVKLVTSLDLHLTSETCIDAVTAARSPSATPPWAWKKWGRGGCEAAVYKLGAVPVGAEFEIKGDSVATYTARHGQLLRTAIERGVAELATISTLRFPKDGDEGAPLSIGQALQDRIGFIESLRNAEKGSEAAQSGWALVAALGIEELQTELTNRLPSLDVRYRKSIAVALASHPSFGDYAPLRSILRNGVGGEDGDFPAALTALRAEIFGERFWEAIQARIEERPELARELYAQARCARAEHMPQVSACYQKLRAEMAGPFLAGFIVDNDATVEAALAIATGEREPARLRALCAALGDHYRANKHKVPTKAGQKYLLEAISRLQGDDRVAAIYSTGWITSMWRPLFTQRRTDWSPVANLAVISCSVTASDLDTEIRKAAFTELCELATGPHEFSTKERRAIDGILPALFDLLSGNGAVVVMGSSKVVRLLLAQPPASPHAKAFAKIIPDLFPGYSPYFGMDHPEALDIIELALKNHSEVVRETVLTNLRAHAHNNPERRTNDPELATLLLSQPPESPDSKAIAEIIPKLLPGHTYSFRMTHPDALGVIELALKHHSAVVRESAIDQIRKHAANDPNYSRLLPP